MVDVQDHIVHLLCQAVLPTHAAKGMRCPGCLPWPSTLFKPISDVTDLLPVRSQYNTGNFENKLRMDVHACLQT